MTFSRLALCAGCLVWAAGVVLADPEATFPSTSGDLADPVAWGGTYAETMTLPTSFTLDAGTYYFSSNVTFSGGFQTWGRRNPLIDQTSHPDVVIKLGGIWAYGRYSGQSATFKGGTYDLLGKEFNTYRGGAEEGVFNGVFTLKDSAVVTNSSVFRMTATEDWRMEGQTAYPTTMNIGTQSRLFTGDITMGVDEGFWCLLNVTGGGEAHATGFLKTSSKEDETMHRQYPGWPNQTLALEGRHHVTVSDAGSLLDVGGDFWCGTRYFNDSLTVTNGGVTKVGGTLCTGYGGASNILVKVTGAGSKLEVGTSLIVGNGKKAADNRVVIENGATFKAPTFKVGNNSGADSSTNCSLVVSGAATTFDVAAPSSTYLMAGRNNRLTFTDGVQWTDTMPSSAPIYYPAAGVSNVFEVTEGATVGRSGIWWMLGLTGYDGASYGRILVGNNATMTGLYLYMGGVGNELVVSNGTFACGGGWNEFGGWNNTKTRVVLQGTHPKITCGVKIGNGQSGVTDDVLRFEVPAEGYASSALPLLSNNVHLYGTARLEADVSAWQANAANGKPVEYMLMHLVQTLSDTQIAAANKKLPIGCRFRKNGRYLYLRCAPKKGLVIVFR